MHKYRTHHCNELNKSHIGEEVKLSGWIYRRRDHGQLLFIDLRDHYGITQCVFTDVDINMSDLELKYESVITVSGKIVGRSPETVNSSLSTGAIELRVSEWKVESTVQPLPFALHIEQDLPEELRLRNRFLDLRREKLHKNIVLRSAVIAALRSEMQAQGFMEFQTPILTASSPEGARDYLVPSRLHPGKFYALPQAPQQFKQLLMIAGFDRYFQIAPCFRDEDARADRSPGEFYQLDIEMSFVEQEDVFAAIEPVMYKIFSTFSSKTVSDYPFMRITYHDAMLHYGSDKPDLRFDLKIEDVSEVFRSSSFDLFSKAIANGAVVRAIPAPNIAERPRSFYDKLTDFARSNGAGGLAYIVFADNNEAKGPIAKFLNSEQLELLKTKLGLNNNDGVFFTCDKADNAAKLAGKIRLELARQLDLIAPDKFVFCWVIDFPFFEWDEDKKKIDFNHNPFSMPQGGLEALQNAKTDEELLKITAYQYDIVCNGIELSSGAIRNHNPELMYKAFEVVGYSQAEVNERFGGIIRAFNYGAPPHGGIAPGVDRMVMLIADEPNIREIIAFPMNQQAEDLLMNAPATVDKRQLQELSLQLNLAKK